jgi:hypothetical protein
MSDPNAPQDGLTAAQPSSWQSSTSAPEAPIGAPGDPDAPGAAGYSGAPSGGSDAPKQRGKLGRIIVGVAVVLVLAVVGVVYNVYSNGSTASKAKEGDCLSGDAVTSDVSKAIKLNLAKCDAADARYKVVGLIADKSETEVKDELCQPFAAKGAEVIYWQEKSSGSGKGNVLCLAPAK